MSEEQRRQLDAQLWGIANLLRGKVDPDDYRDYILGFIFYKYLSEKQHLYADELLKGESVTDFELVKDQENSGCNSRGKSYFNRVLFKTRGTLLFNYQKR